MRVELEVKTALLILLAVLVTLSLGSAVGAQLAGDPPQDDHLADAVELEDGSILWPYTSGSTSFADRTLSINLIIYGPPEHTSYVLQDAPFTEWDAVSEEREDIAPAEDHDINESTLGWGGAEGSKRYVWVDPADQSAGQWLSESYQLESGDYLGHRQHIRAFEDPGEGRWTVLQGHEEHWDWFHLRHSVHSVEDTQLSVESELGGRWYVEEYYRADFGNDQSADADGWVTIIHLDEELIPVALGALVLVGGMSTATRELRGYVYDDPHLSAGVHAFLVMGVIAGAYLLVRFGALAVERNVAAADPKLIVAVGYPLLVVGLPVLAYLSARQLDATVAFWAAIIGFVGGIMIDYTYLGVTRLPLEAFVHRIGLAIAIGLIAAGASQTAREPDARRGYVRTGVLLWIVAIVLPLWQFF